MIIAAMKAHENDVLVRPSAATPVMIVDMFRVAVKTNMGDSIMAHPLDILKSDVKFIPISSGLYSVRRHTPVAHSYP